MVDLITKLLIKDKSKRLGAKGDSEEIMAHPWFADINIETLMAKTMEPPFKPKQTDGPINLKYFDSNLNASALNESILPKENVKVIKQN